MNGAPTLILFDIDGTLVLTGGAGGRAMTSAFAELFGIPEAFSGIAMPGRTDSWLLSRALEKHHIPLSDPRVREYRELYLRHLAREIERPAPAGARKEVLPGVRELLDALSARSAAGVYLALLTGNYEAAARLKLEHFDVWKYFACGAFGDELLERNALLPKVLHQVVECGGPSVAPRDAVVIGDTPLDVGVARAGGARSIAVATGSHGAEDLRASGADVVFQDLSDTAAVLRAIER